MFQINDDMSIHVTRGDSVSFSVTAEVNGHEYTFKAGDVVRINVFEKKNCENVVLSKDFGIEQDTTSVDIFLTQEETRIGDVISKPKDYWYEVELNPYDNPQTIIGYDDDGAKVFKLFPEGDTIEETGDVEEGDIPVVDNALSLTSSRPVQNRVVSKALVQLSDKTEKAEDKVEDLSAAVSVERARIDMLIANEGYLSDDVREYILYDGTDFKAVITTNGVNAVFKAYGDFTATMGESYETLAPIPENLEPFNGIPAVSKNGVHFDFVEDLVDEENDVWEWRVKYQVDADAYVSLSTEYSLKNITVPNDEVEDIRIDVYGIKHTTAGDSVRSQVRGMNKNKGLTDSQLKALDTMFRICAYKKDDVNAEYEQFKVAFGIDDVEEDTGTTLVPAISIVLDVTSLTITEQENAKITATVKPADTTDILVWTSTNETVATVTDGTVKPISNGNAIIIATCGGVSAACSVTVNIAEEEQVTLSSISATYTGTEVVAGTSVNDLKENLTVRAIYSDGSTAKVTGYTLNGTIVVGTNTITVSYSGKTTTFVVVGVKSVEDIGRIPATSITLNMDEIIFTDTVSQRLIATVEPSNTTDEVVWTSKNENIVTVTDGIVKPIADSGDGGTYVYATAGDVTASCYIKVDWEEEVEVTLTGISASYSGGNVGIGTDVNTITGVTVTASYSDGTIATVNDYTLSGIVRLGTNTIYVEYKGFQASFKVIGEEEGFALGNSSTFSTSVSSTSSIYGYDGVTVYVSDTIENVDGEIYIAETGREAVSLMPSTHEDYDASAYDKLIGKYVCAKYVNGNVYYIGEDATWKMITYNGQIVQYSPAYKVSIKEG